MGVEVGASLVDASEYGRDGPDLPVVMGRIAAQISPNTVTVSNTGLPL